MDRSDAPDLDRAPVGPAVREGHFALESGLHADRWFDLDTLFCDPSSIAPRVERLADLLSPYAPTAICGPMTGGALLAQSLASRLGLRFLHSQRDDTDAIGLYPVRYRLPNSQRSLAAHQRVALVDDMISAGSATRATCAALRAADAVVVAVGCLYLCGDPAELHFAALGVPVVAVQRMPMNLWPPDDCPACRSGVPITVRVD